MDPKAKHSGRLITGQKASFNATVKSKMQNLRQKVGRKRLATKQTRNAGMWDEDRQVKGKHGLKCLGSDLLI